MKVLLLIPSLAVSDGGTAKVVPALAAALARRGVSVDLVTTHGPEGASSSYPINSNSYRLFSFARTGGGGYKVSLSLLWWLLKNVPGYDVVLVHSVFNFPVLVGALASRVRRVPYVVTPHGMLEPWALSYKAWKKRAYFRMIERPLVLSAASSIQALNSTEKAGIEMLGLPTHVFVLPNGAAEDIGSPPDIETFFSCFPSLRSRDLILFLHRIDPKKGVDLLAQAYGIIRAEFPNSHLVMAGPDNVGYTPKVQKLMQEAGIGDAVTFTGMLEGDLKRAALAASSIFVLPSYSEGFSMSVLEAMAAALPCVITDGCNFPEAGEAGAARVTAIDPLAFATALRELLEDPAAARAMGERAKAFVKRNYTWDQIAARCEAIVEGILANHAR